MSHSLGDHVKALPGARSSRLASDFGRRSWGLKWSNSGPENGTATKHAGFHWFPCTKDIFSWGRTWYITHEQKVDKGGINGLYILCKRDTPDIP